jgi:hypothetical protein
MTMNGCTVVLTDIDIAVPLLQRNAECNTSRTGGRVSVRQLYWCAPPTPPWRRVRGVDDHNFGREFDLILAADVIYDVAVVPALIGTLRHLSRSDTTVMLTYFPRVPAAGKKFFDDAVAYFDVRWVGAAGGVWRVQVPEEEFNGMKNLDNTKGLFLLKLKAPPQWKEFKKSFVYVPKITPRRRSS